MYQPGRLNPLRMFYHFDVPGFIAYAIGIGLRIANIGITQRLYAAVDFTTGKARGEVRRTQPTLADIKVTDAVERVTRRRQLTGRA